MNLLCKIGLHKWQKIKDGKQCIRKGCGILKLTCYWIIGNGTITKVRKEIRNNE